jgi:hypothetical protein
MVYGHDPPILLKYDAGLSSVAAVDAQLRECDKFLDEIRQQLLLSQDSMRDHHNKKRRATKFQAGDWAWLRLQHQAAAGMTLIKHSKVSPRFFAPYKVVERIGDVAYHLQLPAKARIHDVFHVALLKKFEGVLPTTTVPLPTIQHGRVLQTQAKVLRARLNCGI